ncbi:hypothetical protein BaRGS_00025571, partial [Batillaria attramentaria]
LDLTTLAMAKHSAMGDLPSLEVRQDTLLEEPDYDQMRDERTQRTRQAMQAVDASLTSCVLPQWAFIPYILIDFYLPPHKPSCAAAREKA